MATPRTIARIEARIQRRAAHCLQFELSDPRGSFITVTGVKMASDLSSGKILYSVLGDEAEIVRVEHMLKDAAGFIQRQIARVLEMRNMPRLTWVYDDSLAHAAYIDQVIDNTLQRDREIDPDYDKHVVVSDEDDVQAQAVPGDDSDDVPDDEE